MAELKIFTATLLTAVAISFECRAEYTFPGRPDCPFSNPGHTWPEYLSGKLGTGSFAGKEPFFSVKFDKNVGTLSGGKCYTVSYHGGSKWKASGYNNSQNKNMVEEEYRYADPDIYEMNIWGAVMTFDEAGVVRLKNNDEVVGRMFCTIGSACDK